jgi:hypothetical protein
LLVAISFLLHFLKQTQTIRFENSSAFGDAHRQNSSGGTGCGDHYCRAGDACWAHRSLLYGLPISPAFISLCIATGRPFRFALVQDILWFDAVALFLGHARA